MPKHRLIRRRNIGSLTFFVCICFVMAPKSCYIKSVNHKVDMWNTNRPRRLYFTIFFNLHFPYFPTFFIKLCLLSHVFSGEFLCFHVQLYPFPCTELILNHIYSPQFPAKNLKTIELPLPNRVVNIGQDAQWNVSKHRICKLSTTDCVFLEIFDFDY
jgi:hypothetical protein